MKVAPKDFTSFHKVQPLKKKKLGGSMKMKTSGVGSSGLFKKKSSGGIKPPKVGGIMSKLGDLMAGND